MCNGDHILHAMQKFFLSKRDGSRGGKRAMQENRGEENGREKKGKTMKANGGKDSVKSRFDPPFVSLRLT